MRRLAVLTLLVLAAILPPAASAHAVLLRTAPGPGAVVSRAPAAVRLVFDDTVRVAGGNEVVRNGDGSVLRGAPRVEAGRVLVLPLEPRLRDGAYSVRWSIVSDDGHRERGVFAFAVGTGHGAPVPELEAGGGLAASAVAARALFLAGLLTAAGAAVFRLAVGRAGRTDLLVAGGLAAAAAGAAWLAHGAPSGTRFALAYWVCAGVAAAGAVWPRARELAALALVPVPAVAGHALDAGQPRLLEVAADVVHVAAASVWVGGILALLLNLGGPQRGEYGRRFGRLALVSVAALAASGLVRALGELSAPGQLVDTGYGRALLVKSGLLAVALGLGWLNRSRLGRTGVSAEAAVLGGVVVAVAFLTALPPGKLTTPAAATPAGPAAPPPPPPGAVVLARQDGVLAVALAARGPRLTATVVTQDGAGFQGLDVAFRSGGRSARGSSCGPGCYEAALPHGRAVAVELPGSTVRFDVPAAAPPAAAVVRRAARVFRSLSSVTFDERLASGPGHVLRSRFVEAAPDRMAYTSDNGTSGIVIGRRRWDRERGKPWVASPQDPLDVPAPFWIGPVRNARLLSRTGAVDVVSFYDTRLKAWFEVRIDRATGRTRDLRMTAAAHFMHHRYGRFDEPVRIRPPR